MITDKRLLVELIEQYGKLKEEIGENRALMIVNNKLENDKDYILNKIIDIIEN